MGVEAKTKTATGNKVLEERWGKTVIDAGYTVVPSVLIKSQRALKLKPLEVNVLLHLLVHWWSAGQFPRPSKGSIAKAIDVDPSTVRRCLKRLEAAGYLKREERRLAIGSRPNRYNLTGLVEALKPFAIEEVREIKKRKLRSDAKLAGKKPLLAAVK